MWESVEETRFIRENISLLEDPQSAWPDWAIYWTLGYFLNPLATINLPKYHTFLGNFCKGVKIFNFSSEIIFGQLLWTFGDFSGHTAATMPNYCRLLIYDILELHWGRFSVSIVSQNALTTDRDIINCHTTCKLRTIAKLGSFEDKFYHLIQSNVQA